MGVEIIIWFRRNNCIDEGLSFLFVMRQMLAQKPGIDDSLDVKVDMAHRGRGLWESFGCIVFLKEVVVQHLRNGDEQIGVDAFA